MNQPRPPACSEADLGDPLPLSEQRLAAIAKGLGHPARIKIVQQFREARPQMAHEIFEGCDLAQSTVSEHLRILRKADILFATKDGPRTWYCLRRSVLRQFADAVQNLTSEWVMISQQ